MVDEIFTVMKCFPNSFINSNAEVILSGKGNVYFDSKVCYDKKDVACMLLEWCSRPIAKGVPYTSTKRNKEWQEGLLNGLNCYLGTQFSLEDMYYIYQELGNGVNANLTKEFVESNYDLSLIYNKQQETEEIER